MQDIIERLGKATGPDRELDLAIGEAVGAADHSGPAWHRQLKDWAKPYTDSIDAAVSLVLEGWGARVTVFPTPHAEIWSPDGGPLSARANIQAGGATPAISLCIAAFKARAALAENKTEDHSR